MKDGVELGVANDQVFQEDNSKEAGGAVGSLTRGIISRQALYEHAMVLALIPFLQPPLFGPVVVRLMLVRGWLRIGLICSGYPGVSSWEDPRKSRHT